nr:MAG TPA: hypothetical protein [Caudoviricetes sp.]
MYAIRNRYTTINQNVQKKSLPTMLVTLSKGIC